MPSLLALLKGGYLEAEAGDKATPEFHPMNLASEACWEPVLSCAEHDGDLQTRGTISKIWKWRLNRSARVNLSCEPLPKDPEEGQEESCWTQGLLPVKIMASLLLLLTTATLRKHSKYDSLAGAMAWWVK